MTTVVPVRDRAEELDRCLAAVARTGCGAIVVVCDGSRDPAAVATVAARHGGRLIALRPGAGPAAARNAALPHVATPLVAFVDSDCRPPAGWLGALLGHLDDPAVGAVAPRVRPLRAAAGAGPASALHRYLTSASSLDMGARPRLVRPGGDVAYVPTAALLARTAALGAGFDPALRFGEDVDLVWRMHDAGWRTRYAPEVEVGHDEATSRRGVLVRRYRYGTSAGALARRHGARLAPAVAAPWPALLAACLLAGRPGTAVALGLVPSLRTAVRLRAAGVPPALGPAWTARATGHAVDGAGRLVTTFALPALGAGLTLRRARRPLLAAAAAHLAAEALRRPPALDPVRWTLARVLDDAAYGTGVLRGALRHRTLAAVLPRRSHPDAG